jgi:hypothetical protein
VAAAGSGASTVAAGSKLAGAAKDARVFSVGCDAFGTARAAQQQSRAALCTLVPGSLPSWQEPAEELSARSPGQQAHTAASGWPNNTANNAAAVTTVLRFTPSP